MSKTKIRLLSKAEIKKHSFIIILTYTLIIPLLLYQHCYSDISDETFVPKNDYTVNNLLSATYNNFFKADFLKTSKFSVPAINNKTEKYSLLSCSKQNAGFNVIKTPAYLTNKYPPVNFAFISLSLFAKIFAFLCLLILPFLGNAQEKPLCIINPFSHKDNPAWNIADKNTKIQMLEQAFTQDSLSYYMPSGWEDGMYGTQTMINYNGYNELEDGSLNLTNFEFFLEHNGEFKIPVFFCMYENKTKNAVMVGDNIFDLNDWYIFDSSMPPGTPNRRLTPGDGLPLTTPYLNWDTMIFWENYIMGTDTLVRNRGPLNFLGMELDEGVVSMTNVNDISLVLKNPKLDSIPPQITCSIQDSSVVKISDFDISVSDCESDSSFLNEYQFYKIDSQELDTFPGTWDPDIYRVPLYKKDITIPVSLEDGAHTLKIYGLDLPKNLDSLVINFTQDATPPELVVNSPENTTYHINKIPLDFTASDNNLDFANSYFQLNSEPKIYLNENIPDSIIAEQGQNNLEFYVKDLASNITQKNISFSSDTTNSIAENKISEFKLYPNPTNSNFTIEYFLQKPEDVSFKLYNSQGQELEDKLIKSKVGENKFNVSLEDYSKGIYFYNFISSDYSKTGIIIKR